MSESKKMIEIDGKTKICGLIGCPVEHTLSPLIHNTVAKKQGDNLVYVPFHVERDRVEDAIKGAYALNIKGLNVTVPHKSAVIPYLKELDPLAGKIGAVNTLVRIEGGYKGYNTDMTGLKRAMEKENIAIAGRDVILLGAGGASRAIAFLLVFQKAKSVCILNRSLDKAQELADEVNHMMQTDIVTAAGLNAYSSLPEKKYLCIQSTSVGLYPDCDSAVIEEPSFYEKLDAAVDIIYKPAETKFMKLCKNAGVKVCNGLGMLLYQGIDAYELWNGVHIDDGLCDEIYKLMKEKTKVEE